MYILVLRVDDGRVQPLCWSPEALSTKQVRAATRKFMKDADVHGAACMDWYRLYKTKTEAKRDLPRY